MSLLISHRVAALVVASGLAACGLVDTNVADFNLTLPEKQFNAQKTQAGIMSNCL